jgi:hypothetical protein
MKKRFNRSEGECPRCKGKGSYLFAITQTWKDIKLGGP